MIPRVGLLEGRMSGELASLVRRHGGEPRVAPALRETPTDAAAAVESLIEALAAGEVEVVIFLTGVGATALFDGAERIGRLAELVNLLQRTTNVCRGQKPWMPLKRRRVPISVTVADPYTTAEVVATLETLRPAGRGFALLHYGERSEVLSGALGGWGARVHDLCLYEWQLPEDLRPLEALIDALLAGDLEAVAFTSQVQIRHLLQVACTRGQGDLVLDALRRLVVAAVGPTCAAALEVVGITPEIVPANPKMGPMVIALMERLRSGAARVA